MEISSRWYKAAGASLIAAAITARYVAKWKRARYLRLRAEAERLATGGRYFIGLDLTDPYAAHVRPCDVAVLDPDLECHFSQWEYSEDGSGIIPLAALGRSFLLAVDGPQGLAGQEEALVRLCERRVNAPGRTPYEFPATGKPYTGFITGSVKLYHRLVTSGSRFRLLGMDTLPAHEANLMEVFPGAAWKALASSNSLPRKGTKAGRKARCALLQAQGVEFAADGLPTDDQLDAAMAAWTGYSFSRGRGVLEGSPPWFDKQYNVIREGYIVQPAMPPAEAVNGDAGPYAPTG